MQYNENEIKRYLDGTLSEVELKVFEKKLKEDEELALQVEIEKELFEHYSTGEDVLLSKLDTLNEEYFQEEQSGFNKKWFLLIIPLLLFSFLYYNSPTSDVVPNVITDEIPMPQKEKEVTPSIKEAPIIEQNTNSLPQPPPPIPRKEPKEVIPSKPIAAVDPTLYEYNKDIESLMGEAVRSSKSKIDLTEPSKDQNFQLSKDTRLIPFKVTGITNSGDEVIVKVYDNKAISFQKNLPILELPVQPKLNKEDEYIISFNANIPFTKGLYYLVVQVKGKLNYEHVSRFYVR